jgi:hypothetical protein
MEEKIAEFLRRHPTSSSRQISDGTGLSEWTTNAVLKGMQDSKLVALEPLELGNEKDPKSTSFYSLVRNRNIAFHQIVREEYLIKYLANDIERLKNRKYLYHYTRLENAVKMINGEHWHLGSAENMNDKLEYENGDKDKWRNIFFSSFMTEEDENIGMWSMYSQPWNSGVKISIPSSVAKRWIRGISEIHKYPEAIFGLQGRHKKLKNLRLRFLPWFIAILIAELIITIQRKFHGVLPRITNSEMPLITLRSQVTLRMSLGHTKRNLEYAWNLTTLKDLNASPSRFRIM